MAEFLAAWLPLVIIFLLFLGGGAWISRKQMASYQRHVDKVNAANDELVATNREMIAELREIKAILKDRT